MKREKIDMSPERALITNLIVSTEFCREIVPVFHPKTLKTPYAVEVGSWVVEYWNHYKTAPLKDIQSIYLAKKTQFRDEETAESVADFLTNLSQDHQTKKIHNVDFEIKQSLHYLKTRSLEKLHEYLADALSMGDAMKAEQLIANYKRVEQPLGEGVDILKDSGAVISAFLDEDEFLFQLPGAVGEVVGRLCRGDFLAFLAPMKRGKCLSGGSLIALANGRQVKLETVIANKFNESVSLNANGKLIPSRISHFYDNGEKPVYTVRTRTGRSIDITANHPLYAFAKNWVSIDEGLCEGDFIAVPKCIPVFGAKQIPLEHVRLIAYLLADGGLTSGGITFTKKDVEMKADFAGIARSLGDYVREDNDLTVSVTKGFKSPEKCNTKKLLIEYGMKFCKSIEKEIPECIFTLPKEHLRSFLQTLFSCDGSVFKDGIEYSSGSLVLINQVLHLLLRFGIVSKLDTKTVNGVDYYTLSIRDSYYLLKYAHEIGFIFEKHITINKFISLWKNKKQRCYLDGFPAVARKIVSNKIKASGIRHPVFKGVLDSPNCRSKLTRNTLIKINEVLKDRELSEWIESDIFFDKIESITYKGIEKTYDISVPEYHNFIANDICAHNTWFLIAMAEIAASYGFKVLFVTLEMTKKQMIRRTWKMLSGQTETGGAFNHSFFELQGEKYRVSQGEKQAAKLDMTQVAEKQKALRRRMRAGGFRIEAFPPNSATVDTIEACIDNMSYYDNYKPDVVIVDYADIVAPGIKSEYRHQLDSIWKGFRGMALNRNILVVSASQAEKGTFNTDVSQTSVSEDTRKLAHVTCMVGLNQTAAEAEAGIMRVSQVAIREGRKNFDQAVVTQCLEIGRPIMDSRWRADVIWDEPDKKEKNSRERDR